MPDTIATSVIVAIIALGIACAWLWQIAPSARARRDEARLRHIGAAWFYFAAMAFFTVICGVLAQGLFQLLCKWLWPGLPAKTDFAAMMSMGAFGAGVAAGALYARRLINAMQALHDATLAKLPAPASSALTGPPPSLPAPLAPIARSKILPVGAGVFCITWTAAQLTAFVANAALDRLGVAQGEQDLVQAFRNEHSAPRILAMLLVAIVIAPLWEEIVFRGALFGYLRTRLPRALAFALPAIIFAAAHSGATIAPALRIFAPIFVFALIHSKAYERTGRIGVTIVSHALFNLTTIGLVLLGVDAPA